MLLQYRAAAFAGFVTQVFWGAIKLMVLAAFYAHATSAPPMSFAAVVAYVWLGQGLLGLLPWNVDAELSEKMLTGGVAYELLRPLDLYGFWFARTLAMRTATTTLRVMPMLLLAMVALPLFGLDRWALAPPVSAASGVAFFASLAATVALATAITMVLHVSLFWTISGRGVNTLITGLVVVLSGMVVPLPLFPDWAQTFLHWQPFRGLADVPFRIYSGNIPVDAAAFEIALQIGWAVAIVAIGRAVLAFGRGRLVVQGG
jgi:ABC-2 type transport system permease protein